MRATPSDTASGPRDRELIATFRLTRAVALRTVALSVVAFFGFAYCFGWIHAAIRGDSFEPIVVSAGTLPDGVGLVLVSGTLIALVVVPHELLHGLAMGRYGGSPSYGVGVSNFLLPYAYAGTTATGYTRSQLLVAVLAPFVVLTTLGLAAMAIVPSTWLVLFLATNAAGSVGDLRMAAVLVQYPSDARITALPTGARGFAIYGSATAAGSRRHETVATIVTGTVSTLALGTVGLILLVFHSLAVGTGTVVLGGDGWLLFRHEVTTDGSAHLELDALRMGAVAIAGGLVWALVDLAWEIVE